MRTIRKRSCSLARVALPVTPGVPACLYHHSVLNRVFPQQQARKELGFGAGGRASFGIAEASFSARFARSATSSALSVSSVWLSEYRLPSDTLVNPKHSEIGQAVGTNDERWRETCGDRYVNEITRGAKLFVSVRIDFSSEQAKEDFQTKFQLSGPLYSANADLKTASDEFSQDARVRVSAFQIGGDVSKLTAVFGDTTENRASFVQCSLGDFVRCASVVEAVLAYAADTAQGFPSQIAPDSTPGAAPLFYRTSDYTAAAIYPAEYPGLAEAVRLARRSLETSFNREFEREILAERLLAYDLGSDNRRDLAAQREIVQTNIVSMLAASKTCYDTPTACVAATESMELLPVDDTVFILPPLPTADYRILTTRYGLWSREESTAAINADPPEPYVDTSWFPIFPPPPPPPPGHDHGFRSLKQVAYPYPLPPMNVKPTAKPVGEASTVLYIRGQALTEAVLYFENNRVQTIPLQPDVGSFPEKTGDGFALVVVETTRSNPGWLDIDIDAEINKLSKEMPRADGVFYLLVGDDFGRQIRYDIKYVSWWRIFSTKNPKSTDHWTLRVRQYWNWWHEDSPGTEATSRNAQTRIILRHRFGSNKEVEQSPAEAAASVR